MNRIDICKNIIQSINELYSSKASMFQNLSCICEDLPSLDFPSVSKQALSKARHYDDGIKVAIVKNGLRTNVDMNNNEVDNTPSIIGLDDIKWANTDQTKKFAKYAVVKDNYRDQTWQFFTNVSATFKIK